MSHHNYPPEATAFLANSLLPEVSFQLEDHDPRQGVLHRQSLKVVADVLLDLLDTHDVPDLDQIRRDAAGSLVLEAAIRAGLLDTDQQIASAGRLARANSLMRECERQGLTWIEVSTAVVAELNRQLAAFWEGRREVPFR